MPSFSSQNWDGAFCSIVRNGEEKNETSNLKFHKGKGKTKKIMDKAS